MAEKEPIVIDCDWPTDLAECEVIENELLTDIEAITAQMKLHKLGEFVSERENWHGAATFARIHKRAELRDLQNWMRDIRKAEHDKQAAERAARHEASVAEAQERKRAMKEANIAASTALNLRALTIAKRIIRERLGEHVLDEIWAEADAAPVPQLKVVSNG